MECINKQSHFWPGGMLCTYCQAAVRVLGILANIWQLVAGKGGKKNKTVLCLNPNKQRGFTIRVAAQHCLSCHLKKLGLWEEAAPM